MSLHVVRVGAMGAVGRFRSADGLCYPRGRRVILRSVRGLELGEVLAEPDASQSEERSDGDLLRIVTVEDELLFERLERRRDQAYTECVNLLASRGLKAALVDVELLMDGQSLYFYFLGEVSPEVDALTAELAEAYDGTVKFRQFTDTLLEGCGPGCGTEEAAGQGGCSSCTSCAVASACKK